MQTPTHPRRSLTLIVALLLFAFGVLTLTALWQSLWLDEVYSIWFVRGTFAETWARAIFPEQNPHASLYYAMLWAWIKAAGANDLAARFFSIIFGMLSLATAYRLTCDWAGTRVALIVALLMAVSPFFIWYAQEARQYALYLFFGLLSTLCLSRVLNFQTVIPAEAGIQNRGRQFIHALAYVLTAAAMAYSHYFAVFVIAAQFVGVFVATARDRRRWPMLLVMGIAVAVLCAPIPWLLSRSGRTFDQADITRVSLSLPEMLQALLAEYATRLSWPPLDARLLLLAIPAALMVLGLIGLMRRRWQLAAFVLIMLIGPALLYWPLSARVSVFTPKYVIACFPFFVIALGVCVGALLKLKRVVGIVALFGALVLFSWGTVRDLTQPDVQRENWRFVGDYLQRNAAPDDVVLTFADYAAPVIEHYYPDGAAIIKFAGDPGNPAPMFDIAQQKANRVLWLLLSHDQNAYPNHKLLDIAYARYPWAYAQYPSQGNIKLLGFSLRWRRDSLPTDATPVRGGVFANGLELIGFHVDSTRLYAKDRISHPPSNWIHVVTYWRRAREIDPTGAQPSLRLVGSDGGEYGGELSRRPNVFDFDPPEKWEINDGTLVEAHYDINLNPTTPPGTYHLEVRMLQGEQRLPRDGSHDTALTLAPIEIVP